MCDRPMPSEERRSRKTPLPNSVRLPSAKTSGAVVALAAVGENIQKQAAAAARVK